MSVKSDVQDIMQDLFDNDLGDSLGIKNEIGLLFQDLFDNDLLDEGVSQIVTYHVAGTAAAGTYDDETGVFV
jgi:hypothetical protein